MPTHKSSFIMPTNPLQLNTPSSLSYPTYWSSNSLRLQPRLIPTYCQFIINLFLLQLYNQTSSRLDWVPGGIDPAVLLPGPAFNRANLPLGQNPENMPMYHSPATQLLQFQQPSGFTRKSLPPAIANVALYSALLLKATTLPSFKSMGAIGAAISLTLQWWSGPPPDEPGPLFMLAQSLDPIQWPTEGHSSTLAVTHQQFYLPTMFWFFIREPQLSSKTSTFDCVLVRVAVLN